MRKLSGRCAMATMAAGAFGVLVPAALAQGQVNGAGATLFVDFFRSPAITNDFIDVDGDGASGFTPPDITDQLGSATNYGGPYGPNQATQAWWTVQYRSVGSIEGYEEWVRYQTCGDLPESIPSERGIINSLDFAVTGVVTWAGAQCTADTDGDGVNNMSGTPICPDSIDFANTDVVTAWVVRGPSGSSSWRATPTQAGYGLNAAVSNGDAAQAGESNLLASLMGPCGSSLDIADITDTPIAFSPVAIIANRGSGLLSVRYTDLQYMFVTGRSANGENYAVAVRDVGSGTRNASMNPLGIDPSFGVGDHVGRRVNTTTNTNLGPSHQVSNCGGSSVMENAVQMRRIAIGYTGLSGASRAISDALSGNYEIVNVIKDIDTNGDSLPDGTLAVRPNLTTVLFNGDANTGYQIGGIQTFATVGDPDANRDVGDPRYDPIASPVSSQNTADFINNIVSSIDNFIGNPGAASNLLMPSEFLANTFFLAPAVQAVPNPQNPKQFLAQSTNAALVSYIQANNVLNHTPAFGSVNAAGKAPVRTANPDFNGDGTPDAYSDGRFDGQYIYCNGGADTLLASGLRLSASNRLTGDFNRDGVRDVNDISGMLTALASPRTWDCSDNGGDKGSMAVDVQIPEVIGDLNGDGSFDSKDVRYFADGFALVSESDPSTPYTTKLDRKAGFEAVDDSFGGNFFGTLWGNGATYVNGESRFDVAGAAYETPGASPVGADGVIDLDDYNYVLANFGDWMDLDAAAGIDLSCDMDGDLDVDQNDADAIGGKLGIGCPNHQPGCDNSDIFPVGAPDCIVNISDLGVLLASYAPGVGGKTRDQGDIFPLGGAGDGFVNLSDLGQMLTDFNTDCR